MTDDRIVPQPISRIACTIVVALGIGLSLFTVLLAIVPFDCGLGDCASISQSQYGRWFGIPVGIFAFLMWSLLYLDSKYLSAFAKACLAGGSVYFVYLQLAVLGKICPYCAAHAILCLLVLFCRRRHRPYPFPAFLAIAAAIAGLLVLEYRGMQPPLPAKAKAAASGAAEEKQSVPVESASVVEVATVVEVSGTAYLEGLEFDSSLALPWIAPEKYPDRAMVVSLFCRKCMMALGHMVRAHQNGTESVAPLVWKADEASLPSTRILVAAVLSRTDLSPDDSFNEAFTLLGSTMAWFGNTDTSTLENLLREEFPDYMEYLPQADELLERHHEAVTGAGISVTPTLLVGDTAFRGFQLKELYHTAP